MVCSAERIFTHQGFDSLSISFFLLPPRSNFIQRMEVGVWRWWWWDPVCDSNPAPAMWGPLAH